MCRKDEEDAERKSDSYDASMVTSTAYQVRLASNLIGKEGIRRSHS